MNVANVPETVAAQSLGQLLQSWASVAANDERIVSGVQTDSRRVRRGDLFIALQGLTVNALDYLPEIISSGAVAVVVDANSNRPTQSERQALVQAEVALIEVDDLTVRAGEIVSRFYGDPSRSLKVIGVTGTDGKTSVCHLLAQALNEKKNNCGVIGTLGSGFTGNIGDDGLTTPDAVTLQSLLARFRSQGAGYTAMEVSSHALSQSRVSGIVFDIAVLTNLGRDHLDYHGDMQSYRSAKEMLFLQPELRAAVINADDDFGNSLVSQALDLELTTYGANAGEDRHVRYSDVRQDNNGLGFVLEYAGHQYSIESELLGGFNVQNLAATFAVLVTLGLSPELAAQSLHKLDAVPGRMEASRLPSGALVVVDYAHNPHALESVLRSVADHLQGQLTVVFGCGGDRDQGKRPMMAAVAEQYAHKCIITDDNPRSENGDEIVHQIVAGFNKPQSVVVERDRRLAIGLALENAGANDMVLVAGKGHENYQLVGEKRLEFSDSAVVAEYTEALGS